MAIIDCPQCGNKVSDKQTQCPHCGLDMTDLSEERLHSLSKIKTLKNNQSIMTQQAIAMILFLVGVFMFYNSEYGSLKNNIGIVSSIGGFSWYIVNRFRMLVINRKKR